MQNQENLTVHPVIAKLKAEAGEESVVTIEGYVGPSSKNIVRLYSSLELSKYVDILRDDVLHYVDLGDEADGRVRVYVIASADIRVISVNVVKIQADQLDSSPRTAFRASSKDSKKGSNTKTCVTVSGTMLEDCGTNEDGSTMQCEVEYSNTKCVERFAPPDWFMWSDPA